MRGTRRETQPAQTGGARSACRPCAWRARPPRRPSHRRRQRSSPSPSTRAAQDAPTRRGEALHALREGAPPAPAWGSDGRAARAGTPSRAPPQSLLASRWHADWAAGIPSRTSVYLCRFMPSSSRLPLSRCKAWGSALPENIYPLALSS